MSVPAAALYGASTQRAVLNFPISGYRFSRPFYPRAWFNQMAAAQANHDLGLLDGGTLSADRASGRRSADGRLDEHFPARHFFRPVRVTSTNTNANEVIANRCAQLAGKPIGSRELVHPNDHVNMGNRATM